MPKKNKTDRKCPWVSERMKLKWQNDPEFRVLVIDKLRNSRNGRKRKLDGPVVRLYTQLSVSDMEQLNSIAADETFRRRYTITTADIIRKFVREGLAKRTLQKTVNSYE